VKCDYYIIIIHYLSALIYRLSAFKYKELSVIVSAKIVISAHPLLQIM